jgi:hypothetical protein
LGAKIERDGAKIRLDQYLDQWLKTIKSRVCSKTYESYESLLAKYIRPSLGKKSLLGIRQGVADTADRRAQAEDGGVQDPHSQLDARPSTFFL